MTPTITLEAGDARLTVHPDRGGRVGSLEVAGVALLRDSPHPTVLQWGCYPMAPWAGRIRHGEFAFRDRVVHLPADAPPHALHGTVHDAPWEVVDASRDQCELRCALDHDGRWPFGGVAHQHVVLHERGATFVLSVFATGTAMPVVVGWHPCFRPPVSASLRFGRQYVRDDEGIATNQTVAPAALPWPGTVCDDCFTEPLEPIVLRYPGLDLRVESDCDHWVVYDGAVDALCVEPQSGPPDAANLGVAAVLEPGELLQRTMTWAWTAAVAPPSPTQR